VATNRGGVNVPVSATWNGRALKQAESQLGGFKKSFSKTFMGLGAGLGAAVGIGALVNQMQEMATAAAEDQKSVVALSKAMSNIGFGAATTQAEAFISQMMLATGVADDQLRPAYQKLITASGSLESAQQGLTLGLDLQAAGYGELSGITKALSAAYAGNTTALSRLKLPLDASLLASKDMVKITAALSDLVGGQAAAAADTYAGKMARVTTAVGEAQETIGYELLRSLDTVTQQMGGPNGFIDTITAAGDGVAGFVAGLGGAASTVTSFANALLAVTDANDGTETSFMDMLITVGKLTPGLGLVVTTTEGLVKTGQENIRVQSELAEELQRAATMRDIYSGRVMRSTSALEDDTTAAQKNKSAIERLISAQERLNGGTRSMISTNLRLRQLRQEGPDASGGKKGKIVTADDRRRFGLDYAETVADKYDLLVGQGKLKKASNVLESGREYLAGQVSGKFADRVLGTPKSLDKEIDRRDSARGAREWRDTQRTVINNFNFGDLKVASPADAVEQAKKAARLRALSNAGASTAAPIYQNANQGLGLIR
jgi:hypothetical protein